MQILRQPRLHPVSFDLYGSIAFTFNVGGHGQGPRVTKLHQIGRCAFCSETTMLVVSAFYYFCLINIGKSAHQAQSIVSPNMLGFVQLEIRQFTQTKF